ncbi:MAG: indole-3-glycerol phosphate synthase TrpC [Bacteroidales bacterium]
MKTILETIMEHKRMEVLKRRSRKPLDQLKKKTLYHREPLNPLDFFKDNEPNIIAEFKRKSPSGGNMAGSINPVPVVESYKAGGAMASSILTDRDFFGGSFRDLENVKSKIEDFPLLRKDFMFDTYQVHEAKAYGADIILLIASVLDKRQVVEMTDIAGSLGLSVLFEVHGEEELEKWVPAIKMVGVNNRNLNNLKVDIGHSVELYPKLPKEAFKISESGIKDPEDVKILYSAGYRGFLMGERFMKSDDPGGSLKKFISQIS